MSAQNIMVFFIGVGVITVFVYFNLIFPKRIEKEKMQKEAKQKEESK